MVTINPIKRALVPKSSVVASRLSSPNYDEFQNDREIWEILQRNPHSILAIKMPHCDRPSMDQLLEEGSDAALAHAAERAAELRRSPDMHCVENLLYVYEIRAAFRPDRPQIGLGCYAKTAEILTEASPQGVIIRNEGIRESKMHGRADLIRATRTFIGVVNNAVEDRDAKILAALNRYAASRTADYEVLDERGNRHRVWLVLQPAEQQQFIALFAAEPYAYVADGNHRSAAAAMLGYENFLTVFFPSSTMGIHPYNRLLRAPALAPAELRKQLEPGFEIKELACGLFAPQQTHHIGLYTNGSWLELMPKPNTYDPANAVESIDSDIVQRWIFSRIFDIQDARDDRLTFVGSNKDAAYLKAQVDSGAFHYAFTLPPVTMDQFMEVCRQRRMMPPKSTWFEPKIRSGLLVALLD